MRSVLLVISLLAMMMGGTTAVLATDFQKGLTAAQSGDFATALREWTPLAKQGYAPAQSLLGSMYHEGKGVPQNHKTAVKWFTLAA
jgi:uncharacterized protein